MTSRRALLGACTAGLVTLAGLGWHALRVEMREHSETFREILGRLDRSNEALLRLSQKTGTSMRVLGGLRSDLGEMLARLSSRLNELSLQTVASEERGSTTEPALTDEDVEDSESFPPLPKGLSAPLLLSSYRESRKVWDIIRNPLLNPQAKEPDSIEKVMILRELVHANAQIDMLRTDVQVGVAEARLILADAGEYIDYAPGEKYLEADGSVTVGEKTEDGKTRMYYLSADEFPEIHEKRAEQARIAERAVRKIVRVLQ